jgi:hypothetical protein
LFTEALLSDGWCIVVCLAIVAQHRVYKLQYATTITRSGIRRVACTDDMKYLLLTIKYICRFAEKPISTAITII